MKDNRKHPHLRLVEFSETAKKNMEKARTQPSITCPKCGMKSFNPNDIEHGYCGNCHEYTGVKS